MIDSDAPIKVAVDPDIMTLIPGYIANRKRDIGRLRGAVADGDFDAIRAIAHQWRGSGGGYGLHPVTECGTGMGEAARAGDGAAVGRWIDEIDGWLERVEVVPLDDR